MLFQRLAIGFIAIVVWGIFSSVVSDPNNSFFSNLLNGLANFCFFFAGQKSDLFRPNTNATSTTQVINAPLVSAIKFRSLFIRTSFSLCLFAALINIMHFSFIYSVDQAESRQDMYFTQAGYRDIQTYAAGFIAFGFLFALIGYFYHLGFLYQKISLMPILAGCLMSISLIMIIYLLYGIFEPISISKYLKVEIPTAVGDLQETSKMFFDWLVTLFLDVFSSLFIAIILYAAAYTGFLTRLIQNRFLNKKSISP